MKESLLMLIGIGILLCLLDSCHGKYLSEKDFEIAKREECGLHTGILPWYCRYGPRKLSDGALLAVIFGALAVGFGLPILFCYCCKRRRCCGRRKRKTKETAEVTAPLIPHNQESLYTETPILADAGKLNQPLNPTWQAHDASGLVPVASAPPYPVQNYPHQNYFTFTNPQENIHAEPPPPYEAAGYQPNFQESASQETQSEFTMEPSKSEPIP